MISFAQGNLLEADAEALVNTVNTVGVMGKGVALMFREAFPKNYEAYKQACEAKEVRLGKMFVTATDDFLGPKWIINFPTKGHWRYPSKMSWIDEGLDDLRHVIAKYEIKSIAIPPLGAGNGRLDWNDVRPLIESKLWDLADVEVIVFEPTPEYQNVAKRSGVEKLTPPRALVAELIRRYSVLGIECSLLEVHKLGYFLERYIKKLGLGPLAFEFEASKFGPYSDRLRHMLNALDGSYLRCNKRLADAGPFEIIHFRDARRDRVDAYLNSQEVRPYRPALEATSSLIDGFESPLGMELLATVDWMITKQSIKPTVNEVKKGLKKWIGRRDAGSRKLRLFEDRLISLALETLMASSLYEEPSGGVEPVERRKDPAAQEMGRKGGKARASKLSPEERSEIARKAAERRWEKHRQKKP